MNVLLLFLRGKNLFRQAGSSYIRMPAGYACRGIKFIFIFFLLFSAAYCTEKQGDYLLPFLAARGTFHEQLKSNNDPVSDFQPEEEHPAPAKKTVYVLYHSRMLPWTAGKIRLSFSEKVNSLAMDNVFTSHCSEASDPVFTGFADHGFTAEFSINFDEKETSCLFSLNDSFIKEKYSEIIPSSFSIEIISPDASMIFTEVLPGGSPDFTEMYVTQSGTTANTLFCVRNTCRSFPDRFVHSGDLIVFWSGSGTDDVNISEGPSHAAWDFYNAPALSGTDGILTLQRIQKTKQLLINTVTGNFLLNAKVDQDYEHYWQHWLHNPSGFLDAFVYGNRNGSWTGCGTTGNTSCLAGVISSGFWKIIRNDSGGNPGNVTDLNYWLESDAVLNNGTTNGMDDNFIKCTKLSSYSLFSPAIHWHYMKGNAGLPSPGSENNCP